MARGGYREGSGGVPTWKHGKTKTIRVPEALASEILEIARRLDEGEKLISQRESIIEPVTESKVLDLSRISIRQVNGVIAVYLEDLVKAGYELRPQNLALMVEARIRKTLDRKDLKPYGSNPQRRR